MKAKFSCDFLAPFNLRAVCSLVNKENRPWRSGGKKGFWDMICVQCNLFMTENTLFVNLMTQNTIFDGICAMVGKSMDTSWPFELYQLRLYSFEIYLCQNDLDLFQQIRASILHIQLTCDYSTGSPSTKSHWVPSSHLTLETELTCNSLIWGRGAGGAGAFLKFKSKNAQCNAMSAKTCFAHSLSFISCIYSSSGDYEHGWIWRSAYECHFWTNYKGT